MLASCLGNYARTCIVCIPDHLLPLTGGAWEYGSKWLLLSWLMHKQKMRVL